MNVIVQVWVNLELMNYFYKNKYLLINKEYIKQYHSTP